VEPIGDDLFVPWSLKIYGKKEGVEVVEGEGQNLKLHRKYSSPEGILGNLYTLSPSELPLEERLGFCRTVEASVTQQRKMVDNGGQHNSEFMDEIRNQLNYRENSYEP
jgi:hypothetical protein